MNANSSSTSTGMHRHALAALLCMVVALVLIGSPPVGAATVDVRAGDAKAAPGADVKVPVRLATLGKVGAMHIELLFDPAVLKPGKIDPGQLVPDDALVESNVVGDRVVIALVSVAGFSGDGVLVVPHFTVIGKAGSASELSFDKTEAWEATTEQFSMQVTPTAGRVSVVKSSAFPWWIVAAAVALLLMLLLLVLLVRRRRRDRDRDRAASPVAPPASPAPASPAPASPAPASPAPPAEPAKFCANCGAPLRPTSHFCPNCGSQLG